MKNAIPVFLIAALSSAVSTGMAATQENFVIKDAQDLAEVCSTTPNNPLYIPAIHFCQGYIVGAYHYYRAVTESPDEKPFVCLPKPEPSRNEVVAMFTTWMKGHPELNGKAAIDVLFQFASEKFPCKA